VTGNTNLTEVIFRHNLTNGRLQDTPKIFNDKFTLLLLHYLNFQGYQISVVVQNDVALNDNSCTDISYKYSNTPIICSGILHFLRFYALLRCWPNAHTNNVSQILYHFRLSPQKCKFGILLYTYWHFLLKFTYI